MATAKKKKTKSIGQVSYLTKQVESLEKDLIRKDIEKLDTKIDNLESKVESNFKWLKWLVGGGLTALLSIILYLHSDTNKRFDRIEIRLDKRFDKIERAIESINQKLK